MPRKIGEKEILKISCIPACQNFIKAVIFGAYPYFSFAKSPDFFMKLLQSTKNLNEICCFYKNETLLLVDFG